MKRQIAIIVFVAVVAVCSAAAHAQIFYITHEEKSSQAAPEAPDANTRKILDKAEKSFEQDDSETAIKLLSPLAKKGNLEAQRQLLGYYWVHTRPFQKYDALDIPSKEELEVVGWLRKAANGGSADAADELGDYYAFTFLGPERDYSRGPAFHAAQWYRKAADLGSETAADSAASIYVQGRGVRNQAGVADAIQWLTHLAEKEPTWYKGLGDIYRTGTFGLKKDNQQALKWYRLGSDKGDGVAMLSIGRLYKERKDYAEALKWFQKCAELKPTKYGAFWGTFPEEVFGELGQMHENGLGVRKDEAEAFRWYLLGAERGNPAAKYKVGLMYQNGQGVAQSYARAHTWFRRAAGARVHEANVALGKLYEEGQGVRKDYAEAMKWYRQAIVGYVLDHGRVEDCPITDECNDHIYRFPAATYHIGFLYENGLGVAQDRKVALKLYQRAAKDGFADAKVKLKALSKS